MGTIITLGGLAVLLITSIVVTIKRWKTDYRGIDYDFKARVVWVPVTAALAIIFGLIFLLTSYTNVPSRTVGIVTSFGKATGTVGSGLNWIAPWAEVTEFPTINQPLDLDATDNTDSSKASPVGVKFLGGGSGAVNVNMNWQIKTDQDAIHLWENWKDFDLVKDKVVNQKAQSVVYQIFGKYTPEQAVDGQKIPSVNREIQETLNALLASDGIVVENVSVKKVDVDPAIQDRINKQVSDLADQNRAKIKQDTAKIDAQTNQIKQQQLTPLTLLDKCLDIMNNWDVQKNGPLPAAGVCGQLSGGALALK